MNDSIEFLAIELLLEEACVRLPWDFWKVFPPLPELNTALDLGMVQTLIVCSLSRNCIHRALSSKSLPSRFSVSYKGGGVHGPERKTVARKLNV